MSVVCCGRLRFKNKFDLEIFVVVKINFQNSDSPFVELVSCVYSLLYGCAVFPEDEHRVLETLFHLLDIQLASHLDPRLLLRRGNVSFCQLYRLFSEGMYSAKV